MSHDSLKIEVETGAFMFLIKGRIPIDFPIKGRLSLFLRVVGIP